MENNSVQLYFEANIESIKENLRHINMNLMMRKMRTAIGFNKFSIKLYESDPVYREETDELVDALVKYGEVFRQHINEGLVDLEKWFVKSEACKNLKYDDIMNKIAADKPHEINEITTANKIFISNMKVALRMYEKEIKLLDASSIESKKTIDLYKSYILKIKAAIREHITFSNRVAKKHVILSEFHCLEV